MCVRIVRMNTKAGISSEWRLNTCLGENREKQKPKGNMTLNTFKLRKIKDDAGTRTERYKQTVKILKLEIRSFLAT